MPSVFTSLILDVVDVERSLEFYSGLLQLPVRQIDQCDGHRLVYLKTGQTEILLIQQPPSDQVDQPDRSSGLVINFLVRSLPDLVSQLQSRQVPILRGLEQDFYGDRSCLVADPDGYAVLLSEEGQLISPRVDLF